MIASARRSGYLAETEQPFSPNGKRIMKKSIMRATLPSAAVQPLVKFLEPLKKAGFDGIQLGVLDGPGELTPRTKDEDVIKLAKACKDAGIEPHSLYGGIRFFREDEADRKRGLDDAKHILDIASALGCKTILIHPGQLSTSVPYDLCWKLSIDGLNTLKDKAERQHLRLGLENVWNKFLMSPLEARRLVEEVNSPAVGIWFDIGNVVVFGYPEQWLRILGLKNIVGLHIKEFKRGPNDAFGTFEGFVPLFHGSVNWPVVMKQLAAMQWDDYLITEVNLGKMPLPEALRELSAQLDVLIGLAKA
jgi:L-ribulose-5-phosphate 3-epimerase